MALFDFVGSARGDDFKHEMTYDNGHEAITTNSWDKADKFVSDSYDKGYDVSVSKPDKGFFGLFGD